ncbi:hypothetical protein [Sulfurirhabdus autotrophica]|uniref:DUF3558 domain-containing protein n=1 Tax=Sulfurirhabdus autotrophica TaxID=1706046 RepID=A0A4R3XVS7_9PROT|nr:hypothetical protein [Sulfurirhabdus autotrophica]TCV82911.1 hypothetical protein EDC63_11840 [Sulfurirhabdus autotrophica]
MRHFLLVVVQGCLMLAVSTASAADRCALLSKSDTAALLGQPVAAVVPAGPQRDEDSSGQLTYCTYRGASLALVLSVVEFNAEAEARKQLSVNLVRDRMDAADAKVTEEPGLGDKAFFGTSANGVMYTFLKKNKVVGIALGGAKASAASKVPLRAAALSIAAKL